MKKFYLALLFSSIAVFILAMLVYGIVIEPFTSKYISHAIALAMYIAIGDTICFIIMYVANRYTKGLAYRLNERAKTLGKN